MEEKDIKRFAPVTGIVIYKRDEDYYLQSHQIIRDVNKFTWGAGKPLQKDHLSALVQTLKSGTLATLKVKGLMPNNVLLFRPEAGGSKFIWYIAPKTHTLTFSIAGLKDGEYAMPGLIFAVADTKLYVFSYKGEGRPDLSTEIHHAPFFNVDASGVVCMGTISESRKRKFLEEELDRWERRFFGGIFTTAHWDDKRLKKGSLTSLLKDVFGKKEFPQQLLVKHKSNTLEQFLKQFTNDKVSEYED